jgi:LysM repeat protein
MVMQRAVKLHPAAVMLALVLGACGGGADRSPSASASARGTAATRSPRDSASVAAPTRTPAASRSPQPSAGQQIYIVKEGDSRRSIARQFGITRAQLKAANPQLEDGVRIEPGQVLNIPEPPEE